MNIIEVRFKEFDEVIGSWLPGFRLERESSGISSGFDTDRCFIFDKFVVRFHFVNWEFVVKVERIPGRAIVIKVINNSDNLDKKVVKNLIFEDDLLTLMSVVNERFEKDDVKGIYGCLHAFVGIVLYLGYGNKTVTEKVAERKNGSVKNHGSKGSGNKTYSLTEAVRYAASKKTGTHVITCEHWEVRGHWRHYKSGKVVYVKPFHKGKNRDVKPSDKVYTI